MPLGVLQTVPVYSCGLSMIIQCASLCYQRYPSLEEKLYVHLNSGAHRNILVARQVYPKVPICKLIFYLKGSQFLRAFGLSVTAVKSPPFPELFLSL